MKILNLQHGTEEWKADRHKRRNASEAGMMMGCHPNVSRNELLEMKATGAEQEFSAWFEENVLEKGHAVEEMARPVAEEIIGDELFPVIASDDDDWLGASYDGQTMDESVNWECKQWNEGKAEKVRNGQVPDADYWQVLQGLEINRGSKTLYMVTDGTADKCVHIWVEYDEDNARLMKAGWKQFEEDVKSFTPKEVPAQTVGHSPEALPALHIELTGQVQTTNLPEFKEHALAVLRSINRDLQTDQDFADAEKTVKWAKDVETRLDAARQHALSQTRSIDQLFSTIDAVQEETRAVRLDLNKLVTERKKAKKLEIAMAAKQEIESHIEQVNASLADLTLPPVAYDFNGAMKGKRTIKSLQSAADDEVARAKIEANQVADLMRSNIVTLDSVQESFLFADRQRLALMQADDLKSVITARIAEHKAKEEQRQKEERERIRREEQAKAEAEARAKIEAEAKAKAEKEEQEAPSRQPEKPQVNSEPAAEYQAPEQAIKRPSDQEILRAVATMFQVDVHTAASWVLEMNQRELQRVA